jgi:chromosome condensin MukBEF ATPase and DNA-binding subunit MukB
MENQNEQSKAVTMQIRADERTKEQFADFCKTLGVTQGAAMQQLLHVYELDAAKRMKELAGSADVIDDVRSHMDAVINAFLVQLEHNVNTNERFKQEYAERMESKEKALREPVFRIEFMLVIQKP